MSNFASHVRAYATENRHRWNMDIVAAWTDDQLQAVIARAKSARFAITLAWRAVRDLDRRDPAVVAVYGMPPVKAVSLHQYLAAAGGIAPHPELKAIFDGPVWVGGYGPLVRRSGMALDEARRVAVEGGYLHDTAWDAGVSTSTVNDLLDATRLAAGRFTHGASRVRSRPTLPTTIRPIMRRRAAMTSRSENWVQVDDDEIPDRFRDPRLADFAEIGRSWGYP